MTNEFSDVAGKPLSSWEMQEIQETEEFVKRFPPTSRYGFQERMRRYHQSYGRMHTHDFVLENIVRADNLFFDDEGFRIIRSLGETEDIVRAMASNSYGNPWERFSQAADMYLIPTTEFIEQLTGAIKKLSFSTPLEVGANDGTLTQALRHSGIPNIRAADDFKYGGRFSDSRANERTSQAAKSTHPFVEVKTVDESLEDI